MPCPATRCPPASSFVCSSPNQCQYWLALLPIREQRCKLVRLLEHVPISLCCHAAELHQHALGADLVPDLLCHSFDTLCCFAGLLTTPFLRLSTQIWAVFSTEQSFLILQGQLDAEREAVEDAVQRRREADEAARGLQEETVHLQVQSAQDRLASRERRLASWRLRCTPCTALCLAQAGSCGWNPQERQHEERYQGSTCSRVVCVA